MPMSPGMICEKDLIGGHMAIDVNQRAAAQFMNPLWNPAANANQKGGVNSIDAGNVAAANGGVKPQAGDPSNPDTSKPNLTASMFDKGHGNECGHCTSAAKIAFVNKNGREPQTAEEVEQAEQEADKEAELDAEDKRINDEVMTHEMAHASTAGEDGGAIVIDKKADHKAGVRGAAGHVPVKVKDLDPSNPEAAKASADRVRRAALAPGEPSGQDYAVAAMASQKLAQANDAVSKKQQRERQQKDNPETAQQPGRFNPNGNAVANAGTPKANPFSGSGQNPSGNGNPFANRSMSA